MLLATGKQNTVSLRVVNSQEPTLALRSPLACWKHRALEWPMSSQPTLKRNREVLEKARVLSPPPGALSHLSSPPRSQLLKLFVPRGRRRAGLINLYCMDNNRLKKER